MSWTNDTLPSAYSGTNDSKPSVTIYPTTAGSPIGLLLALTYAESVGYTSETKPSGSYTFDSKP